MRWKRKGWLEMVLCTSRKVDAGGLVTPFGPAWETTEVKLARPALELRNLSTVNGGATYQVGWELSHDNESWPSSTTTPNLFQATTLAAQNTEGIFYSVASGDGFENISSSLNKRCGRWVVWVKNVSGNSALECALASIRVDTRSC